MNRIRIKFKDNREDRIFKDSRGGGSFHNTVSYEGAFVIVRDVWDSEYAFPATDVKEVQVTSY
jgi:hypothetical protein